MMKKVIDVMIIGAQKAGTTSLLRYLGEHPRCISHPQKEFAFFVNPSDYQYSYEKAYNKYFSNYPITEHTTLIAKSAALFSSEDSIKLLYEHNPNCKLILILRNPVERAYSSYLMEKNYGNAKFDFSELPELIRNHKQNDKNWDFSFFIDYGLYINYINLLYKYFPSDQLKVVIYKDFKVNPLLVCKEIFSFIDLKDDFCPNTEIKYNVTKKTKSQFYARIIKHALKNNGVLKKVAKIVIPENKAYKYGESLHYLNKTHDNYQPMSDDTRKYLIDFYKPYNKELEELIHQDLSFWNE